MGGKPNIDQSDQKLLIKDLTKQLETLSVKAILNDKTKNQIKDEEIKGTKIRFQKVDGLPPKELRKLVDDGKKQLGEGIVVVFANKDEKVGVAVGVTNKLIDKFDAVKFVKLSSEIIGGQGGGGRKDFAQAGGQDPSKINEAFEKLPAKKCCREMVLFAGKLSSRYARFQSAVACTRRRRRRILC